MNRFGKVEFCSRKEVSEGLLLCEASTGIVLEERTKDTTVMVSEFKGARISDANFLDVCMTVARKYVGNKNTPIHVDLNPWNAAINENL